MVASCSWLLGLIVALLCTGSFRDSVQAEERLQSEEVEVLRGLNLTGGEKEEVADEEEGGNTSDEADEDAGGDGETEEAEDEDDGKEASEEEMTPEEEITKEEEAAELEVEDAEEEEEEEAEEGADEEEVAEEDDEAEGVEDEEQAAEEEVEEAEEEDEQMEVDVEEELAEEEESAQQTTEEEKTAAEDEGAPGEEEEEADGEKVAANEDNEEAGDEETKAEDNVEDWCYFGCENSLPHWGKHYPKCNGRKQSPINIDSQKVVKNQELGSVDLINFSLPHTMKMLKNNGHTVECELKEGTVGVRGGGLKHKYTALQFHFHWGGKDLVNHPGSEHSLNRHRSPLEMHVVSRRSDLNDSTAAKVQDGFAVMGFFIESNEKEKQKETSKVWESFTDYLQKIPRKGDKVRIMEPFSMHQLLKGVDLSKYYRYNGSLTTPPCDEAVVWTIFKDPIRISKDLLLRFPTKIYFGNVYRPQQPLNNRVVYSSTALTAGHTGTTEHILQHPTNQGP